MTNLLHQLENNEAVLLVYLADELPPEERAQVDALLNRDTSMRAELEKLRSAYASAEQVLRRLDEITAPPIPDPVAIRQATRIIKQWQARQLQAARRQLVESSEKTLRFAWWTYPVATAAAIALALLVWWSNLDTLQPAVPYVETGRGGWGGGIVTQGMGSVESFADDEPPPTEDLWADNLERSFDMSDELLDQAVAGDALDQAELELLAMWDRRSDFPDALFVQEPNP